MREVKPSAAAKGKLIPRLYARRTEAQEEAGDHRPGARGGGKGDLRPLVVRQRDPRIGFGGVPQGRRPHPIADNLQIGIGPPLIGIARHPNWAPGRARWRD